MTIQELFIRSNEELKEVIDQIDNPQWDLVIPAGVTSTSATLHESVNYHAYDDSWVPDMLDGKTREEVGNKYEFILATAKADTPSVYSNYNALAIGKVRSYDDMDKIVHLSYGDFSAHDYLQHIISFRAFRCYDIAKLIGASTKLDEDFVQDLWNEFSPIIESYRQMGIFPPAIEVPDDSDMQTKLLALVGRE